MCSRIHRYYVTDLDMWSQINTVCLCVCVGMCARKGRGALKVKLVLGMSDASLVTWTICKPHHIQTTCSASFMYPTTYSHFS